MNLKNKVLSLAMVAGLLLGSATVSNATPNDNYKDEKIFLNRIDSSRALEHIRVLSEDIGDRVAASEDEYEAALYIQDEFRKIGYDVEIQEFDYERSGVVYTSWNVVATRKPTTTKNKVDKNDSDEIVHVTAHYDSVKNSPGANDNASGTAAMLEIAKSMNNIDIDKEVRFIACGAEEVGLRGSKAYVDSLTDDEVERSVGNFNLDMVATAYEPCTELAVYTYNQGENVVTDAMKKAGEQLAHLSTDTVDYNGEYDAPMGSSDHVYFALRGIPSALFINVDPAKKLDPRSAIEPYYHKPEDNMSNLSEERLERTIKLVGLAVVDTLNVD